jgi:hypothetical protein
MAQIPRMLGIDRIAVLVATRHQTALLGGLFHTVVMELAKALEIGGIEEQPRIAAVRTPVVDDHGTRIEAELPAHHAGWVLTQMERAHLPPAWGLVEMCPPSHRWLQKKQGPATD